MVYDDTEGTQDIDLSDLEEAWATASAEGPANEDVPDGTYRVLVERAELKQTRETKKPMLSMQLGVLSGEHRGRKMFRNSVISTPKNAEFLKRDLAACGLDVDAMKISDLPAHLESLLDIVLEVRQKTSGEFTNVYINKRLDDTEPEETNSDDLPF